MAMTARSRQSEGARACDLPLVRSFTQKTCPHSRDRDWRREGFRANNVRCLKARGPGLLQTSGQSMIFPSMTQKSSTQDSFGKGEGCPGGRLRPWLLALAMLAVWMPGMTGQQARAAYADPKIFLQSEEIWQLAYVSGLYDGYELANALGDGVPYKWLVFCVERRRLTIGQMTDMFENWLKQNPEQLKENLPFLYQKFMKSVC